MGITYQLLDIGKVQLFVDVPPVCVYRMGAEKQFGRNLRRTFSGYGQADHFFLALGQK